MVRRWRADIRLTSDLRSSAGTSDATGSSRKYLCLLLSPVSSVMPYELPAASVLGNTTTAFVSVLDTHATRRRRTAAHLFKLIDEYFLAGKLSLIS